jgi:hypothetical protein
VEWWQIALIGAGGIVVGIGGTIAYTMWTWHKDVGRYW